MKSGYSLLFSIVICSTVFAQAPKRVTSADIHQSIKKLNVLANVFYVAAHPDDENTRLISLLANQYKANVYYLSMTRGDGGQNLIGSEVEDLLGVIRTNELLQARRVDGGKQLFTRANDFGYSKKPSETMRIWNREEVLSDVVWHMRKYKPDIIINRFNTDTTRENHGHHTSSAILSLEAFDKVNNKSVYPEQLKYVEPWQPRRIYFNTFWWFFGSEEAFNKMDKSKMVTVDAGVYYPWLGKSNGEIASESRSMHRCQGMGASLNRGSSNEYLEILKGDVPKVLDNPFAGIDITWNRVKGGKALIPFVTDLDKTFKYDDPAASIEKLNKLYQLIQVLPDTYWKKIKSDEVKQIIQDCAGVFIDITSSIHAVAPGEKTNINAEFINRSNAAVKIKSIKFNPLKDADTTGLVTLSPNKGWSFKRSVVIPAETKNTGHYWLAETGEEGMYKVEDQNLRGLPVTPASVTATIQAEINGIEYTLDKEITYKWVDPAKGELYRPFEITVPAFVNLDNPTYAFADNDPKRVNVRVRSASDVLDGALSLDVPIGWRFEPSSLPVKLKGKGIESTYSFLVYPPSEISEGIIKAKINVGEKSYDKQLVIINYDHIPYQMVQKPSFSKLLRMDLQKGPDRIAYIPGAGDEIAQCLSQVGYKVTTLNENELNLENFSKYDAIVIGIRAYNTVEQLKNAQPDLMKYVQQGGNVVVQYNTSFRMVTQDFSPYKLTLSNQRVSQEEADMRILRPDHPVLNQPNKITSKDFDHWVQERGLYYASDWDKDNFTAILSSNDRNEPARDGGLLVAKYGDGNYIYTSLAFFRQLPQGVSGAYRLFSNLLALKKNLKS